MHSDNAPSHFKSSKTMHYVTKLPARLASWALAAGLRTASGVMRSFTFVWEFGAPGHGKGVWDGLGAWMKRTVRQDVVDHRPPTLPTIKTETGTILSPAEVPPPFTGSLTSSLPLAFWLCFSLSFDSLDSPLAGC